jgi:hypothetical protein
MSSYHDVHVVFHKVELILIPMVHDELIVLVPSKIKTKSYFFMIKIYLVLEF